MSKRKASEAAVRKQSIAYFDRASMVERLMDSEHIKDYGLASLAVNEFFDRFLQLKKAANDADGTLLIAPRIINAVWHMAVLDTAAYAELCEHQVGFFVHFSPLDDIAADRLPRYQRTVNQYNDMFVVPNYVLWPHPGALDDPDALPADGETIELRRQQDANHGAAYARSQRVEVVVSGGNRSFSVNTPSSWKTRELKTLILRQEGIAMARQQLFFEGVEMGVHKHARNDDEAQYRAHSSRNW
jgi:hypothetical protein